VTLAWLGVDRGDRNLHHADALAAELAARLGPVELATTHVVDHSDDRHYACAFAVPIESVCHDVLALADEYSVALLASGSEWSEAGSAEHRAGARAAAAELRQGQQGRAVLFAGSAALRGAVTVEEITRDTAIDQVEALGGMALASSLILTEDHVRPLLRHGQLVLTVTPTSGGFQPFERRSPHNCCADD
jgi:hypothetical protein